MVETGVHPDFIVVDGMEGGTGAAPLEFADHLGVPLRERLVFVRDALIGVGARERIRIGCSGKIVTAFNMTRAFALGADWCNSARGFMFALGCIQSLSCNTDRCLDRRIHARQNARPRPRGRGQDRARAQLPSVEWHALAEITAAAGLNHPHEFRPEHFSRRISAHDSRTFAELYPALEPGELIAGARDEGWCKAWGMAEVDSFAPAG
jgi:glutamate synthase domain-containing protein 2